jgi:uncharacterized protein (TIGR02099 family)
LVTGVRRTLRRSRRLLGYSLAGLVILAGVCVALASQLLPLLSERPQQVADWLAARSGLSVEVSSVRATWARQGPRFDLQGLRIGAGADHLDIGRAQLQVDLYAGLLPGRALTSLVVTGSRLELQRDLDGDWRLLGLTGDGATQRPQLHQLDGLGELVLHDAQLRVRDARRDIDFLLPRIDARLRSVGRELRGGLLLHPASGGALRLAISADIERGVLQAYLGGEAVQLDDWKDVLPEMLQPLLAARIDGGIWIALNADGDPVHADFDLRMSGLSLLTQESTAHALALLGRWERGDEGWIASLQSPWTSGGSGYLRIEHRGADWRLDAADWPLAAPLALLAAQQEERSPLPPALRDWLQAAQPRGLLAGLRLQVNGGGLDAAQGDALVTGLAVDAVGDRPGISAVDVALTGTTDSIALQLAGHPLRIDWPAALLAPLEPSAHGRLQLFRDDDGMRSLEIERLQVRGEDYGFTVGGGLKFDGGAPSVSLRAEVERGPIVAAKRFWIRHRMPEATVRWLDAAIEDGWIERGHVLLQGDLDDWPFAARTGRFEAEAIISDTRLRFRPDWPAAESLSGSARFIDNSMLVEADGTLLDMQATRAVGRIARFAEPVLELDIAGNGSGTAMLGLLRQSPLQRTHGEHFDNLTVGGRGDVQLQMTIPLQDALGEPELQGVVQLADAELADSRWGIAFSGAAGPVLFSDSGVRADSLAVQFVGQPGQFSLAVGSHVATPANVAEASLQGRFEPASLLDGQDAVAWLLPYVSGASEWALELAVPQDSAAPAMLGASSTLVGTRLSLPAPLAKSDAVQMPLQLWLELPLAQGRLDLRLGELLRLTGTMTDTGRITGVAAFGTVPPVQQPAQGLSVIGEVPVLDLGGWGGLALAGGDGEALLAGIDLRVGELDVLDRNFSDLRLRLSRDDQGGMRFESEGPALQGVVDVPAPASRVARGVTARFDRLHWPAAREGAMSFDAGDPAALPALHVWVGDLRVGDAHLGEARLESFPVDQGMRIERFEARSPALDLFASGDWARMGIRQRSTFAIDFTAQDIGRMLRALGFAALVEGGQTLARLQATWPGSPAAFSLDSVDGTLEASVGKGRVPEVDPGGAGRVFGLLSLSEIPRRLALDFSDFFRSGLAFNRIEGRFRLDDGNAWTENLVIDGPAAEIRIRGRTGLKAQDYAQTMEVLPRAGNVLPVVGALAGGPAGAAIGAVAQAVLSNPFKQMTRTLYSVEGDWKEPRIEVLERGPARAIGEVEGEP